MKRQFLWIIPAVALFAATCIVAEETESVSVSSELSADVSTKTEKTIDGKKVTETNTGSYSASKNETVTSDGKSTSDNGREIEFEHKTETEISKGDHHEVKTGETDSVKVSSNVSTDGNGDTASAGINYSKG